MLHPVEHFGCQCSDLADVAPPSLIQLDRPVPGSAHASAASPSCHAICVLSGECVQMSLAHTLPLCIPFMLGTKLSFHMADNVVLSRLTENGTVNRISRAESSEVQKPH